MPVSHIRIMQTSICRQQSVPVNLDKCWRSGENRRVRWKYRDRNMPVSILNSIYGKMSEQSLPAGFRELPAEEQRRIRESSRAILELAFCHTGAIIISSEPAANAPLNSASCFLLNFGERVFLATAEHVLEETEKRFICRCRWISCIHARTSFRCSNPIRLNDRDLPSDNCRPHLLCLSMGAQGVSHLARFRRAPRWYRTWRDEWRPCVKNRRNSVPSCWTRV